MRVRSFLVLGCLVTAGCGVLLGLEDKEPLPLDGDAATDGAAASEASSPSDGALADAVADADADAGTDACAPASPTDPSRCGAAGACGKDCLGGTCTAGQCGVVTLSTTKADAGDAAVASNPWAVAVSGDTVFWSTSEGDIFACDRRACSSTRRAVARTGPGDAGYSAPTGVFSIAADGAHVYWSQYYLSKLFRANHDGGALAVRSANGSPSTLVLDDTAVYWTNFGAGTSALWRCSKQSCFGPDAAAVGMSNPYRSATPPDVGDCTEPENRCWYANSLTVNGADLAFVDDKPKPFGEIYSIPKGAADASVVGSGHGGFSNPKALTASEGAIYFAQYGAKDDAGLQLSGSIVRLQPSQVPTPLVINEPQPESIVTDGESLFWFAAGSGEIRRCAIGGCSFKPTTLATNQKAATSLVATSDALYWVNASGTEINMLVK